MMGTACLQVWKQYCGAQDNHLDLTLESLVSHPKRGGLQWFIYKNA